MFDLVAGLPLHPLAVHAVVVLLPLMAVITVIGPIRRWSSRVSLAVVAADLLVLVAAVVAVESGEKLEDRVRALGLASDTVRDHAREGKLVPALTVLLVLSAVLAWGATRRPVLRVPAIVLTVLVALAVIVWTAVVGHSGATAVWQGLVSSK